MSALTALTTRLAAGHALTAEEARLAAFALAATDASADSDDAKAAFALAATDASADSDDAKAAFLTALATKGETPAEVAAIAAAFRDMAIDPGVQAWAPRAIDVCGTGGDREGTFNISTATTFVLAAAGVPVLKHGNRSITSRCGSADLLEALGVRLDAPPALARSALDELGFCFFFAPAYHPAFKAIAPVRKALGARGQRSVFNILGPLINPGRPAHQLLGVYALQWVSPLATVFSQLGLRSALVVHGEIAPGRGLDELTTATDNHVAGVGAFAATHGAWRPEDHGLRRAPLDELAGGGVAENTALFHAILAGRAPAGLIDTLVFNSAAALLVAGRVPALAEGLGLARELLLGGAVAARVAATREFYANASAAA